ncbi:unnamed protein product [Closterium sp. Yama58-4]|nr:unnamed protein product [Closterium sp. Yama58-4]
MGREWEEEEEKKLYVREWGDGVVKEERIVEIIDLEGEETENEEDEKKEEEEVEILELDESEGDEVKERGGVMKSQGRGRERGPWGGRVWGLRLWGGWCAVCGATCLNESNYKFHLKGKRHRSALAASHAAAAAPAVHVL